MAELQLKLINGLERLSEVFKTLLWEKAKVHGISPIQIQIILFVSNHPIKLSSVSQLAEEFNLTKATISDAVRILLHKELLEKNHSPVDNRSYLLQLTGKGQKLLCELSDYFSPVSEELDKMSETEQVDLFKIMTKLIYQLHLKGIIQVQRTCFSCRYYQGNKKDIHFCKYLDKDLHNQELQLDCDDFVSNPHV